MPTFLQPCLFLGPANPSSPFLLRAFLSIYSIRFWFLVSAAGTHDEPLPGGVATPRDEVVLRAPSSVCRPVRGIRGDAEPPVYIAVLIWYFAFSRAGSARLVGAVVFLVQGLWPFSRCWLYVRRHLLDSTIPYYPVLVVVSYDFCSPYFTVTVFPWCS